MEEFVSIASSGIRLLTSIGTHLIPGQLSACLMMVKVLVEAAHFR